MTMGQRIKSLREKRGLTQERFADEIGLSKSAIGMYETDKREPNQSVLECIADFFNVDMDYLYGKSEFENRYQWLKQIRTDPLESSETALRTNSINVVRIIGRDGRYIEKRLTDDQVSALQTIIDQLPDASDDL